MTRLGRYAPGPHHQLSQAHCMRRISHAGGCSTQRAECRAPFHLFITITFERAQSEPPREERGDKVENLIIGDTAECAVGVSW